MGKINEPIYKTNFSTTVNDMWEINKNTFNINVKFKYDYIDVNNVNVTIYGVENDLIEFINNSGVGIDCFSKITLIDEDEKQKIINDLITVLFE